MSDPIELPNGFTLWTAKQEPSQWGGTVAKLVHFAVAADLVAALNANQDLKTTVLEALPEFMNDAEAALTERLRTVEAERDALKVFFVWCYENLSYPTRQLRAGCEQQMRLAAAALGELESRFPGGDGPYGHIDVETDTEPEPDYVDRKKLIAVLNTSGDEAMKWLARELEGSR